MDYYEKTAKQIQQLLDKVDEISSMIKTRSGFDAEDVYIDNNEFLQLFKVVKTTKQNTNSERYCKIMQGGTTKQEHR